MKLFGRFLLGCAAGLALLLAPLSLARAELKPLLVVSVAGIDELVGDINYVTKAAGFEGTGKLAEGYIKGFSNGVDRKRPIGVIVAPKEGGEFVAISFVPVSDMKAILATLKEPVGEPKDAGDGVLELAVGPQSAFIKETNGWAFVAQQKEHLADLPADPSALLGTLPKDYTLAAKVSMQNLPADLKKMLVDQMRIGFETSLENAPDNQGFDKELMAKVNRNAMENIIRMLDELEDITVGFNIDAAGQRTYLDLGVTAIAGSRLAKQVEQAGQAKSSFAAFLVPGAAATLNFAAPVAKEDLEQTRVLIEGIKANVQKELDNDPNLDATRRTAAKELIAGFIDVLQKTLEEGMLDGGAALLLEPKSLNFVAGGLVADGAKVEALFKRLAELAKDEADAPEIKLNAGKHGDVNLHTISGPNEDEKAREILGDKINIVLGTGPKSLYLAFGKDGEGLLKKMIDQVSQQGPTAVPSSQLNVALLPILKFAASVDDNPIVPALVSVVEKNGKDKITIVTEIKSRGSNTRILVEEGVLQAIGEGVKQAGVANGGQQEF
ncbi:MAG TPA: hypothetical protein VMP01_03715 [Pirellulaceae bacterium]|nr:hypothetical protein [Pirellulaceae bacterium]